MIYHWLNLRCLNLLLDNLRLRLSSLDLLNMDNRLTLLLSRRVALLRSSALLPLFRRLPGSLFPLLIRLLLPFNLFFDGCCFLRFPHELAWFFRLLVLGVSFPLLFFFFYFSDLFLFSRQRLLFGGCFIFAGFRGRFGPGLSLLLDLLLSSCLLFLGCLSLLSLLSSQPGLLLLLLFPLIVSLSQHLLALASVFSLFGFEFALL